MFYSAWTRYDEPFDAQHHCRQDLDIFRLRLIHREGEYAFADIEVRLPQKYPLHPPQKPYLYLTAQSPKDTLRPLFRGRLWAVPHHIRHQEGHFRLVAAPLKASEKLQRLAETLKEPPFWEPLCVDLLHEEDPDEVLEARGAFFYWDRWTHDVRLSSLSQGGRHHKVGRGFFYDSLKIDVKHPPFEAVHITVSAEWTQVCTGEVDIGPTIAHHCPEGKINTFTPQDFQKRWERAASKLNRSGYHVELAQLSEFYPPFTGILNLYPVLSKPVWQVKNNQTLYAGTEQVRLKRTWFDASLIVSWTHRQQRRETATMMLRHHMQQALGTRGIKRLHIRLRSPVGGMGVRPWSPHQDYQKADQVHRGGRLYQAQTSHRSGSVFLMDAFHWKDLGLCPSLTQDAPSFFTTPRGHQALAHILERARSYLEHSARCVWITITLPFDEGWSITPDDTVMLHDDRWPGGTFTGKVIVYDLNVHGDTGVHTVTLTLAGSVGGLGSPPQVIETSSERLYVTQDYGGGLASERLQTPSGLKFTVPHTPIPGLRDTCWAPDEIVEKVMIQNHAAEQHAALLQEPASTRRRATDVLKECPTMMKVFLKDIRSQGLLDHNLKVDVLTAYASPASMSLDLAP